MDFKQYLAELRSRPIPKEMAFPEAEFRGRMKKVRGYMAERGLDALLVTEVPNVSYMSGFETFVPNNFACVILPAEGEPSLQVAEFEIPGALLNSWVQDVRATRFNDADATAKEFAAILQLHKLDGKRIGLETKLNGFTIELYERLRIALPGATFTDAWTSSSARGSSNRRPSSATCARRPISSGRPSTKPSNPFAPA